MSASTNGRGFSGSSRKFQQASNYCFPFTGKFKVTSPFGRRSLSETYASKNHKGIDLVAQENKTIVSVTNGTVKRAQFQKGYGNYVWIANEDGKGCIYAHMAKTFVKVGQKVYPKTPIGLMDIQLVLIFILVFQLVRITALHTRKIIIGSIRLLILEFLLMIKV